MNAMRLKKVFLLGLASFISLTVSAASWQLIGSFPGTIPPYYNGSRLAFDNQGNPVIVYSSDWTMSDIWIARYLGDNNGWDQYCPALPSWPSDYNLGPEMNHSYAVNIDSNNNLYLGKIVRFLYTNPTNPVPAPETDLGVVYRTNLGSHTGWKNMGYFSMGEQVEGNFAVAMVPSTNVLFSAYVDGSSGKLSASYGIYDGSNDTYNWALFSNGQNFSGAPAGNVSLAFDSGNTVYTTFRDSIPVTKGSNNIDRLTAMKYTGNWEYYNNQAGASNVNGSSIEANYSLLTMLVESSGLGTPFVAFANYLEPDSKIWTLYLNKYDSDTGNWVNIFSSPPGVGERGLFSLARNNACIFLAYGDKDEGILNFFSYNNTTGNINAFPMPPNINVGTETLNYISIATIFSNGSYPMYLVECTSDKSPVQSGKTDHIYVYRFE